MCYNGTKLYIEKFVCCAWIFVLLLLKQENNKLMDFEHCVIKQGGV